MIATYALVVDDMIAVLAARPHTAANGEWHEVATTPRPADTPTSTFDQTIQVVDGLPAMVWVERFFTAEELTDLRRGGNQADLLAKARAALAGNEAAITAATTGPVASFVALPDSLTGATLPQAVAAIGQNRQAIDWLIARDVAHERQLAALIRLIVGADLLDTVDGT
jgi:hypothetical protein